MTSPKKEEIEIPVDRDKQDEGFTVDRMYITAVHYEDADHCAFYAVQAALIHFNQRVLKPEDRDGFQEKRKRQVKLWKDSTGLEERRGAWIETSLAFLLPELSKEGIVPVKIVCTKNTENLIKDVEEVKKSKAVFQKEEGEADLEFPSFFLIEGSDSPHVWFCPDEETFDEEEVFHKEAGDRYVMMILLKKHSE